MNISKINALIPASFEYKYSDTDGNEQAETINLQIRRMSFSTVNNQLQKLLGDKTQEIAPLAKIFVQVIASWNIFLDDAEKEMLPIEEAWFLGDDCPADFAMQLAACIFEKLSGNPQKPQNSHDGSEPAAKSSRESATNSTSGTGSPSLAASGA